MIQARNELTEMQIRGTRRTRLLTRRLGPSRLRVRGGPLLRTLMLIRFTYKILYVCSHHIMHVS